MSRLDGLMKREMTRKQFLITLLTGVFGFFGFSTIMGLLSSNDQNPDNSLIDYGMRDYGP